LENCWLKFNNYLTFNKIQQHIYIKIIINVGNLINSEWGIDSAPWQRALLTYMGRDENINEPLYALNSVPGGPDGEVPSQTFRDIININQTWRAQLGVRYMF